MYSLIPYRLAGRSPYGERGLKYVRELHCLLIARRSPYGERGLKYLKGLQPCHGRGVALLTESVD